MKTYLHKDKDHEDVYDGFIYNSQNVVHPCNGILIRKKE